jgi:hypothetical protein
MTIGPGTLSLAMLAGRTGRGIRVAVIDSGIHAAHPHVGGIAGGVSIDRAGGWSDVSGDALGHGTAVAAAIREKAPDAELLSVKVFDRQLQTTGTALVAAMRWAIAERAAILNLSLGTANVTHEAALADVVQTAVAAGALVVAAAPIDGTRWLPGALPGVLAVEVDWECPRDTCHLFDSEDGTIRARASGLPRPIPGVPVAWNVSGQSFAVANTTGLLALALEPLP